MASNRRPRELPQGRDPLADVADLPFFTGPKQASSAPSQPIPAVSAAPDRAPTDRPQQPDVGPSFKSMSHSAVQDGTAPPSDDFDVYAAMRKISRKATFDLSEEADNVLFYCTRVLQDMVGRQFWAKEKDVLNLLLIFAGRCVRSASFQDAARQYSGASTERSAEIFEHLWNTLLETTNTNK